MPGSISTTEGSRNHGPYSWLAAMVILAGPYAVFAFFLFFFGKSVLCVLRVLADLWEIFTGRAVLRLFLFGIWN
jgi:hypothetical protein